MPVQQLRGRIAVLCLALVLAPAVLFSSTVALAAPKAVLDGVVAVAINSCHSLVLRADGTVWGWGCNSDWDLGVTLPDSRLLTNLPVQTAGIDQVRGIAFGFGHGLAVRTDGSVWAWGLNDHGQVGIPPGEDCPNHPRPCVKFPVPVPGLSGVKAVAATENSSFALKGDGTIWSWGEGRLGQLGIGTTVDTVSPTQVDGLDDVSSISAVGSDIVALRGDGTVWGWGGNDEQATPSQVAGLDRVVAVAAGLVRNVALRADGSVWSWGEPDNPAPAAVAGLGPITAIAGGGMQSGAVAVDGTVWSWGIITAGRPLEPIQVKDLVNIVAIDMGIEGNLALQADGAVWNWGQYGRLNQVSAPAMGTPTP